MTKPKHPPHRLGFSDDPYRGDDDARRFGQWIFLQTAARLTDVLASLPTVNSEAAVVAWARRWNIHEPWVLAHAHATLEAWARYPQWAHKAWFDRDDISGCLVSDDPPNTVPSRPLKDLAHFEWLVRYQLLKEPYLRIGRRADRRVQAVRAACNTLSGFLQLRIREAHRGRPRKKVNT